MSRGAKAVIVLLGLMIVGTTIAIMAPTSSNGPVPQLPLPYPVTTGGTNEVRVKNPNGFSVKVELRSGSTDKQFNVGPQSTGSVDVPDGTYEAYFVYSTQPGALYQGDSFSLNNNGIEIQIVKVVDGNYAFHRVK